MGAPWRSSVSSKVVGFIRARPGGRRVHPVAFGSALEIVGFIRDRWVSWSAPWGSSCSSGVAGFAGVRPWVRVVYPGLLLSLGWTLAGSFVVVGYIPVRPGGRRVHPVWLGSLRRALVVLGFIRGGSVH